MFANPLMNFLIQHIWILSILLCSSALCGQCLVNPYKPLRSAAEEIGLLPDTPSYYIEEKVYRNDTLLHNCTIETMHNYGDRRVAAYNDEFASSHFHSLVSLQRINDSLWIQTISSFYPADFYTDTLWVWMEDGFVHKAVNVYGGNYTFYYRYNDSGHLIQKRKLDNDSLETVCHYSYSGEKLLTMKCTGTKKDTHEMSITYSDTLITESHFRRNKNGKTTVDTRLVRLDTCGNKLSSRWFSHSGDKVETESIGYSDYIYFGDGTYQSKTPANALGGAMTTVYLPREPYPGFRYKEDGRNVERVRRTIWIN
jgi:hypothetical protein